MSGSFPLPPHPRPHPHPSRGSRAAASGLSRGPAGPGRGPRGSLVGPTSWPSDQPSSRPTGPPSNKSPKNRKPERAHRPTPGNNRNTCLQALAPEGVRFTHDFPCHRSDPVWGGKETHHLSPLALTHVACFLDRLGRRMRTYKKVLRARNATPIRKVPRHLRACNIRKIDSPSATTPSTVPPRNGCVVMLASHARMSATHRLCDIGEIDSPSVTTVKSVSPRNSCVVVLASHARPSATHHCLIACRRGRCWCWCGRR